MPGLNGLVVMTPTSIASTGSGNSSSIGANGEVTFSSCATLSLNGVFTSSYDNYLISLRVVHNQTGSDGYEGVRARLRVGGTDNSTASAYTVQELYAGGTSVFAGRASYNFGSLGPASYGTNKHNGCQTFIFGPNLVQQTAWRNVTVDGYLGAEIYETAWTHNQSTAYDGITLYVTLASMTGAITVYGFNK